MDKGLGRCVDPVWNQVTTKSNGKIPYDFLVLTPGLQCNWEKVEGITHDTLGQGNANSIYDFEGAQKTWKALQEFAKKGGKGIYTDTYTKHKCGGAPKKNLFIIRALRKETRDSRQTAIELFYRIEGAIRYSVFHASLAGNI